MVEITKGSLTLTVTKGAYKTMYAPQGWEIRTDKMNSKIADFSNVSENKEVIPPDEKTTNLEPLGVQMGVNNADDQDTDEDGIDLSEIPLSEMSVPQLKLYGKQLGVEVDTDSAKTLRNRIRKSLEG